MALVLGPEREHLRALCGDDDVAVFLERSLGTGPPALVFTLGNDAAFENSLKVIERHRVAVAGESQFNKLGRLGFGHLLQSRQISDATGQNVLCGQHCQ